MARQIKRERERESEREPSIRGGVVGRSELLPEEWDSCAMHIAAVPGLFSLGWLRPDTGTCSCQSLFHAWPITRRIVLITMFLVQRLIKFECFAGGNTEEHSLYACSQHDFSAFRTPTFSACFTLVARWFVPVPLHVVCSG